MVNGKANTPNVLWLVIVFLSSGHHRNVKGFSKSHQTNNLSLSLSDIKDYFFIMWILVIVPVPFVKYFMLIFFKCNMYIVVFISCSTLP